MPTAPCVSTFATASIVWSEELLNAATPLFTGRTAPWPLAPDDMNPNALPRRFDGGAGHQSFFVAGGRPYCLFVVIAGYGQRVRLVGLANEALATVSFS